MTKRQGAWDTTRGIFAHVLEGGAEVVLRAGASLAGLLWVRLLSFGLESSVHLIDQACTASRQQ